MLVLKIILYAFAALPTFLQKLSTVALSIIKGKYYKFYLKDTKYNKMYEISLKVLTLGENSGPLISEVSKLLILCIPHSNFSKSKNGLILGRNILTTKKNFLACQNGTEF